jgi:hypothetical protein
MQKLVAVEPEEAHPSKAKCLLHFSRVSDAPLLPANTRNKEHLTVTHTHRMHYFLFALHFEPDRVVYGFLEYETGVSIKNISNIFRLWNSS